MALSKSRLHIERLAKESNRFLVPSMTQKKYTQKKKHENGYGHGSTGSFNKKKKQVDVGVQSAMDGPVATVERGTRGTQRSRARGTVAAPEQASKAGTKPNLT